MTNDKTASGPPMFAVRIICGLAATGLVTAGLLATSPFAVAARGALVTPKPATALRIPDFGTPMHGNPIVAPVYRGTSIPRAAFPRTAFPTSPVFAPSVASLAMRNNALYGVSCMSWTRCIAVGAQAAGTALAFRPLAEQWTGAHCRVLPSPTPARLPRPLLTED